MLTYRPSIAGFKETNIRQGRQTLRHSHSIVPGEPLEVGHDRQLLMDWHVVDDLNGCERTVHQPVKHPDNPILTELVGDGLWGGSVMRDEQSGLFRMWSETYDNEVKNKLGIKAPGAMPGVYFESEDGLEWRRPSLGLLEHFGSKDSNVYSEHGGGMVLVLPARMHHRGRYARIYQPSLTDEDVPDPENMHRMVQRIAFSEDGIHWTDAPENPVWYGRSDTYNNIVYNPERDVFMLYRRSTINAGEIRRIAYSESKDLINWSQPVNVVRRDELDPPFLYGMPVSRYQGMYLGLLWCLHWNYGHEPRLLDSGKDFKIDNQLAWSRDGMHWERHAQRPIFIPNSSPIKGVYDWGMVQGLANMIEVGDEVFIYYEARPHLHGPGAATSDLRPAICLATLKRDRFVSVDAGDRGGYMLTRPLAYPGGRLHINARTPDGFVRVAVREGEGVRDGEWSEGFGWEKSVPFSGDSLDHTLTWEGAETLSSFPSTTMRLHFWMENAELYSFWFE